jgi:hypothetical protein
MSWPQIIVEVDFTKVPTTALANNTWVDISADVISFTTRRGRSDELARIEAGVATVVLDNSDRKYDPTNAAGPYYGNLIPMRKLRIRAVYASVTYAIFCGFVESWPQSWPGGLDATAPIDVVDAFKYFALRKFNANYSNEFTNWSIDTWLTNCPWPTADRGINPGQSQIQPGTFVNTPALQHFQNVVDVESGLFYMNGGGYAIFEGRHYRLTTSTSQVSQATFDDAPGATLPWYAITSKYDDSNIWNEARITRTGGSEFVSNNATSRVLYFRRTMAKTLPVVSDAEAQNLADWIVLQYADPFFRITTVTIDCGSTDALWAMTLACTISNRITVVARPPGGGAAITQECYIEGIGMTVDHDQWRVLFQLSPAPTAANGDFFWILQDPVWGVLGSTTRLAY